MSTDDKLRTIGLTNPQLAQAKGIDNLSTPKEEALEVLSVVTLKDVQRFIISDAIYELTGYAWIKISNEHELKKRCSLGRKGTRGRDDIVKINQNQEEQKGILGSFREKFKSFIEA